jgi:hypothetical protein
MLLEDGIDLGKAFATSGCRCSAFAAGAAGVRQWQRVLQEQQSRLEQVRQALQPQERLQPQEQA